MQALVVVVAHIPLQQLAELCDGPEASSVDDIGLQGVEERLDVSVLIRGTSTGHALLHSVIGQVPLERRAEELTASVAVENQSLGRPTSAQRGLQCRSSQP